MPIGIVVARGRKSGDPVGRQRCVIERITPHFHETSRLMFFDSENSTRESIIAKYRGKIVVNAPSEYIASLRRLSETFVVDRNFELVRSVTAISKKDAVVVKSTIDQLNAMPTAYSTQIMRNVDRTYTIDWDHDKQVEGWKICTLQRGAGDNRITFAQVFCEPQIMDRDDAWVAVKAALLPPWTLSSVLERRYQPTISLRQVNCFATCWHRPHRWKSSRESH